MMNAAARSTMEGIPEVGVGYGVSDEFRYVSFPPNFLFFRMLGRFGGFGLRREKNSQQEKRGFKNSEEVDMLIKKKKKI